MTLPARRRSSPRSVTRGRTRGAVEVAVSREPGVSAPASGAIAETVRLVMRAEGVRRATMSIAMVTDATIRRLNARHLGHRRVTDVIAFTLVGADGAVGGDVYVAPAVGRAAAGRMGIPAREELLRLVVHGVLHVLGYDHPAGDGRFTSVMWRRQEALLARALRRGAR